MDIFRFTNPTAPTLMEQGQIINGLKTKLWVERYRDAGEFTFTASAGGDIKKQLPIGSFISHVDTLEIMVVENHEISDNRGSESDITITGRSLETFLENRIVGSHHIFPVSTTLSDYIILPISYIWYQADYLIYRHIDSGHVLDINDAFPYLESGVDPYTVSIIGSPLVSRQVPIGTVYERLLELLEMENLGIRIVRPGVWSGLTIQSNTYFEIHKGIDRSDTVAFSYDTGEIVSADYFWTNRGFKNAALVRGKWVAITVLPSAIEYDRRWMYIPANDLDEDLTSAPTGPVLDGIISAMQQRANDILASQKQLAITKAEISKENVRSVYRKDFNVGDLITVAGDYNEVTKMRITEYVEFEDEAGQTGYPTLSID